MTKIRKPASRSRCSAALVPGKISTCARIATIIGVPHDRAIAIEKDGGRVGRSLAAIIVLETGA